MTARLMLLATAVTLSGCASTMSGIGGTSTFGCSAPAGVSCMSVSGVSANINAGTLPSLIESRQRVREEADAFTPSMDRVKAGGADPVLGQRLISADAAPPAPVPVSAEASARMSPALLNAPHSGMPIRTPERVLRIWMAPFEAEDGALHDQKYIYVAVAGPGWAIEANRASIRNTTMRTVFPIGGRPEPEATQPGVNPQAAAQDTVRAMTQPAPVANAQ